MDQSKKLIDSGTVLVVGGCGFLGWHIVNQLLNFPSETDPSAALPMPKGDPRFECPSLRGRYPTYKAKVSVVDLRTTSNRLPGAEYYDGDITSVESMLSVFRAVKPDVVIHTASPSMLEGNKPLLRKVNVDGTKTLLEVAGGEHGDWGGKCKSFVYTSSSSVVHDTQSNLINVDEEWPYVRGKQQLEYYSETKVGLPQTTPLRKTCLNQSRPTQKNLSLNITATTLMGCSPVRSAQQVSTAKRTRHSPTKSWSIPPRPHPPFSKCS